MWPAMKPARRLSPQPTVLRTRSGSSGTWPASTESEMKQNPPASPRLTITVLTRRARSRPAASRSASVVSGRPALSLSSATLGFSCHSGNEAAARSGSPEVSTATRAPAEMQISSRSTNCSGLIPSGTAPEKTTMLPSRHIRLSFLPRRMRCVSPITKPTSRMCVSMCATGSTIVMFSRVGAGNGRNCACTREGSNAFSKNSTSCSPRKPVAMFRTPSVASARETFTALPAGVRETSRPR